MRTGTKGWMDAFFAIDSDSALLQNVMFANQSNPAAWRIGIDAVKTLKDPVLVDFRSADQFEAGHVDNAVNIPYEELWTFDNLEKLNKSKALVVIHDNLMLAGIIAVSFRLLDYQTYVLK